MIVIRTPLRISLFGGGTDFPEYFSENGSLIIGSAINKYIYHCIFSFPSNLYDYNIRLSYQDIEKADNLNGIKHNVFRLMLEQFNINKDIEISLMADLPAFTGLGSSSSFTVGLMNGLNQFKNNKLLTPMQLAEKSIYFERETLNDTVGFQDQIFASYGGFNLITLEQKKMHIDKQDFSDAFRKQMNSNFYLYYSGLKRKAANIEKNKLINFDKNIMHLDYIKALSFEAKKIFQDQKGIDNIGPLLNETWQKKKLLSKQVSNSYIDDFYDKGIECGSTGGKLLGAGGGGFILFYVPTKNQILFEKKMSNYKKIEFSFFASGSMLVSNINAEE